MTLDTLTRAQAEVVHLRVKNSLAQASAVCRDRFKDEKELFRSLPTGASAVEVLPTEDIVQTERIKQCCKRVRIWRRQIMNPLSQYKPHSHAVAGGKGNGTAASTKKSDRRMHLSILMALIVDIYEQRVSYEVEEAGNTCIMEETFPEFVTRFMSTRAFSRRAATDQIQATVSAVLQSMSAHPRVHAFAKLCGLDDDFNPPQKIKIFLHMVERLHRWKAATTTAPVTVGSDEGGSKLDETTMADIVFHTVGIAQHVVLKVVAELFQDEYFWNFHFWHTQFQELRVDYAWPEGSREELQSRALHLAASSRNALLNSTRKIDGDAFLDLMLDVWTHRAKELVAMLEEATDQEEQQASERLQQRQHVQDASAHVIALTDSERALFDMLVDEFWHADVPWQSRKVQKQLSHMMQVRPLRDLQALYVHYVAQLDESRRVWNWSQWPWTESWDWGGLHITTT